ncbi:MAG: 3-deoxy-7-phosphoheptulonate synthase, partial [Candidatus Binatia bacterium]
MIILLKPDVAAGTPEFDEVIRHLANYKGVTTRTHAERGLTRSVVEIHLIGNTADVPKEPIEELPGVQQVVRVS